MTVGQRIELTSFLSVYPERARFSDLQFRVTTAPGTIRPGSSSDAVSWHHEAGRTYMVANRNMLLSEMGGRGLHVDLMVDTTILFSMLVTVETNLENFDIMTFDFDFLNRSINYLVDGANDLMSVGSVFCDDDPDLRLSRYLRIYNTVTGDMLRDVLLFSLDVAPFEILRRNAEGEFREGVNFEITRFNTAGDEVALNAGASGEIEISLTWAGVSKSVTFEVKFGAGG